VMNFEGKFELTVNLHLSPRSSGGGWAAEMSHEASTCLVVLCSLLSLQTLILPHFLLFSRFRLHFGARDCLFSAYDSPRKLHRQPYCVRSTR
jgi:hypothetical protein